MSVNDQGRWGEVERRAQAHELRTERETTIEGLKRDIQAVLDHPEWSLARIRMHLEAIIQERL